MGGQIWLILPAHDALYNWSHSGQIGIPGARDGEGIDFTIKK
jgi:hypothetical protein